MADHYRRGYDDDRDSGRRAWSDRAGDEVRSWLGDDDARRRREFDEREERARDWSRDHGGTADAGYARTWRDRDEPRRGYDEMRTGYDNRGGDRYGDRGAYSPSHSERPSWRESGRGASRAEARHSGEHYGEYRGDRMSSEQGYDRDRATGWNRYSRDPRGDSSPNPNAYGPTNPSAANWDRGREPWRTWGDSDYGYRSTQQHTTGSPWTRDSYSGRGPKGYQRSDDRIREDVSDRLTRDHDVDASDITVEVQSGEVTLTGTVPSRDQKRCAEDCAESVPGVSEVTNNLRVQRNDTWRSNPASVQSPETAAANAQPKSTKPDANR